MSTSAPKPTRIGQGQDVWNLVSGELQRAVERNTYIVWGQGRRRKTLRNGDRKIVRNRGEDWELCNLVEDPYEQKDRQDANPERFESLFQLLESERAKDAE